MNERAREIASGFTKAISFPDVVFQLQDMLNDGVSTMPDVSRVISKDPGLTATLLKFANSPLYGFSGQVATLDRAISLIGMREVSGLVFSVAVKSSFDNISSKLITMEEYWAHSLSCALVSRKIAKVINYEQKEVLFTAGLLHDIGQLAMYSLIPDEYSEVLLRAEYEEDGPETFELERALLGVDHLEVGYEIAKAWHFPEILQDTIRFHHTPGEASRHRLETAVVHIGNSVGALIGLDTDNCIEVPPVSPAALATLAEAGIDADKIWAIIPHVETMFADMCPIFSIAA